MKRFKHAWTYLYTTILVSFTLFVLLDTFVIAKVYTVVPTQTNQTAITDTAATAQATEQGDSSSESTPSASASGTNDAGQTSSDVTQTAIATEDSYTDENISITLTEYREYDTTIYVADVQVSSPEYLKTAFAQSAYGQNITEKTSQMASAQNAILAINGDFYGSQRSGYVLRNGVLYRESSSGGQEDLVIGADGSFSIATESDTTAASLLEAGAQQVLSFGPALVENGEVSVTTDDEVGRAKASNPRTAIGVAGDLHYYFVVSDGRTSESQGLSLYQLAEFMQTLGVETAYNLDGGGSSTMYFNGEVVNNPTTNGQSIQERSVSDIVYIGY